MYELFYTFELCFHIGFIWCALSSILSLQWHSTDSQRSLLWTVESCHNDTQDNRIASNGIGINWTISPCISSYISRSISSLSLDNTDGYLHHLSNCMVCHTYIFLLVVHLQAELLHSGMWKPLLSRRFCLLSGIYHLCSSSFTHIYRNFCQCNSRHRCITSKRKDETQ